MFFVPNCRREDFRIIITIEGRRGTEEEEVGVEAVWEPASSPSSTAVKACVGGFLSSWSWWLFGDVVGCVSFPSVSAVEKIKSVAEGVESEGRVVEVPGGTPGTLMASSSRILSPMVVVVVVAVVVFWILSWWLWGMVWGALSFSFFSSASSQAEPFVVSTFEESRGEASPRVCGIASPPSSSPAVALPVGLLVLVVLAGSA